VKNFAKSRMGFLAACAVVGILFGAIAAYIYQQASRESGPVVKQQPEENTKTQLPRMANLPAQKITITPPAPPPPSYPVDAPVLEQARKALSEDISPEKALSLAKSLPESAEQADAAFLLLEYAAENDNSEAALIVARYYDPTDNMPSGTIRKNPESAYEWYQEALAGGQEEARSQLASLRQWVEERANKGSHEASQLLKNWR